MVKKIIPERLVLKSIPADREEYHKSDKIWLNVDVTWQASKKPAKLLYMKNVKNILKYQLYVQVLLKYSCLKSTSLLL